MVIVVVAMLGRKQNAIGVSRAPRAFATGQRNVDTAHDTQVDVRPVRTAAGERGRRRPVTGRGRAPDRVRRLWLGGPHGPAPEAPVPGRDRRPVRRVPAAPVVRPDRAHERRVPDGDAQHRAAVTVGRPRARRPLLAPAAGRHVARLQRRRGKSDRFSRLRGTGWRTRYNCNKYLREIYQGQVEDSASYRRICLSTFA